MHLGTLESIKSLNVTNLGVVLKRLGWFCCSVLRLIQNSKTRSLQTTQEYKDSKGSGTTVVGAGRGDQKVFAKRS